MLDACKPCVRRQPVASYMHSVADLVFPRPIPVPKLI